MNSITELPSAVTLNTPSWWFWVKAGFGAGVGAMLAVTLFWFLYLVFFVGVLASLFGAIGHR